METKTLDDATQHVVGIMKSAIDPEFGNRFVDLLAQVGDINLSDYGLKENQDATIEVPLVFFCRSVAGGGDGKMHVASIGGELSTMDDEAKALFSKNRLYMRMRNFELQNAALLGRIEELETALESTDYYDNDQKHDIE